MNGGLWWDNIAIYGIALICALLVIRRILIAFSNNPKAGCGSCSKCGPGTSEDEVPKP